MCGDESGVVEEIVARVRKSVQRALRSKAASLDAAETEALRVWRIASTATIEAVVSAWGGAEELRSRA